MDGVEGYTRPLGRGGSSSTSSEGRQMMIMRENDNSEEVPHEAASCVDETDSLLSSLASHMFIQMLSARVLGMRLDDEMVGGMEDESDHDDSEHGVVTGMAPEAAPTPFISLSSLARAEQLLQKSVPLVNGGKHVALTRADVERIRDRELLQFLETNSSMFVKYFRRNGEKERREGASTKSVESAVGSTDTGGHLEIDEEIRSLANAIETFITAFDDDGQEYRICMDDGGTLLVPVDEAVEEEGKRVGAHTPTSTAIEPIEAGATKEVVTGTGVMSDITQSPRGTMGEMNTTEEREAQLQKASVVAAETDVESIKPGVVSCSARRNKRSIRMGRTLLGRRCRLSSPHNLLPETVLPSQEKHQSQVQQLTTSGEIRMKEVKKMRQKPLVTQRPSHLPARGIGLSAEEEQRVSGLMCTDFSVEVHPYTLPVDQLDALNERLQWFREVRGPLKGENMTLAGGVDDTDGDDSDAKAAVKLEALQERTAKKLGNGYMQETCERLLNEAKMRSINAQLVRLQQLEKLEELCPAAGAEQLARLPRPLWTRELSLPPSEVDIRAMIEDARRENALAVERGESFAPRPTSAAIPYLQEKLRLAIARVESLVPSASSSL